jgi:hypothetical protein
MVTRLTRNGWLVPICAWRRGIRDAQMIWHAMEAHPLSQAGFGLHLRYLSQLPR